jgi:hypothetical protein
MPHSRDELEKILDAGLSSYPNAEPLAGIEARVLARIRPVEPARYKWTRLRAVAALSLVMVAFIASLLLITRSGPRERPAIVSSTSHVQRTPAPAKAKQVVVATAQSRHRSSRIHKIPAVPKEPVFPRLSPVTSEEHLLLVLVTNSPEKTAEAFDSLRRRANEPLEITPIVISPLETSGEQ